MTPRDPSLDPHHPDPRHKADNHHAAVMALREKHAAGFAVAQRAVAGAKLPPTDRELAADTLGAIIGILGQSSPIAQAVTYLIEASVSASRVRRAHGEAAA